MSNLIINFIIFLGMILYSIRWWQNAKVKESKKYIAGWGISWTIAGIAFIVGNELGGNGYLGIIVITGLISLFYFLVKATQSESKA